MYNIHGKIQIYDNMSFQINYKYLMYAFYTYTYTKYNTHYYVIFITHKL